MKFRFVLAVFSLIISQFCFTQFLEAQTIASNLTLGSRGAEVESLQQILVSDGFLIMPAGVSYGYFGPLTRTAVARWQSANGVSPALGYFGPISRTVLAAKIISVIPEPPATHVLPVEPPTSSETSSLYSPSSSDDAPAAIGMRAGRVTLFRASPFQVRAGGTIILDGSGFSKTANKIYFSGSNAATATSTNGSTMSVVVPNSVSNGEHELHIENMLGSSKNSDIKIKIRVTDNPQPPPVITGASLSGDTVTVTGTGFTSSNSLFTTFGDSASSISSSGNTLSFRVTDLSRYNQIRGFTQGQYKAALWIFVQNENGMNRDPYKIDINI